MSLRNLMQLWQRRGVTFGRRSDLLRRGEVLRGIMTESLRFLGASEGPVLDVGCGDGIPTATLVRHYHIIGVDFATTMLQRARLNLPSADLLRASVDHLPLRSGSVPASTCYFLLSDYATRTSLLNELRRVLQPNGKLVLADYSLNDDFNNLLDDLQRTVLGKDRGMFRPHPDVLKREVEEAGFRVQTASEVQHPLRIGFQTFIDQLYLSSTGAQYKERQLTEDQWRKLLNEWIEGSEVHVTRRFALVFAEKAD